MTFFVAYNDYGDLVAEADTYDWLMYLVQEAGYGEEEVVVGKVSP